MTQKNEKGLHPRNAHNKRYDFKKLIESHPGLEEFVAKNNHGDLSIDFSEPKAVIALNKALLSHFYQVENWELPKGHLCPPIPGRVDYIHYIADILAKSFGGKAPKGKNIRGLDIGVGANCVYPIVGHSTYGWRFVGTDIDKNSVKSAQSIIAANKALVGNIEIRRQKSPDNIFNEIISKEEKFDFTMCNPPFHCSLADAEESARRKMENLGTGKEMDSDRVLNFGGQESELWCPGGEVAFIKRMIKQSVAKSKNVLWFTTLVSKRESLTAIGDCLKNVKPAQRTTIVMRQGQKTTRIVAWTFHTKEEIENWTKS